MNSNFLGIKRFWISGILRYLHMIIMERRIYSHSRTPFTNNHAIPAVPTDKDQGHTMFSSSKVQGTHGTCIHRLFLNTGRFFYIQQCFGQVRLSFWKLNFPLKPIASEQYFEVNKNFKDNKYLLMRVVIF